MTQRYLVLGKILIALLAVGSPIILFQSYVNRRELLHRDFQLRASFSEERQDLLKQLTVRFFSDAETLAGYKHKRVLPSEEIEGLSDFPPLDEFAQALGIRQEAASTADPHFIALLGETGNFFSGLPRRYAGLVETLRAERVILSKTDLERLHRAAADFWHGHSLTAEDHAFLLARIPATRRVFFEDQTVFLGLAAPRDDGFAVNIVKEGVRYHLVFPKQERQRLNHFLKTFNLDVEFHPATDWLDWDNIRLTLRPEFAPPDVSLRRTALLHAGIGGGVELMLLLIYGIMIKYEKINKTQKQLLATTSHELRTPLAVIRQFAEMLGDQEQQFGVKHRTYHRFIHRECLKMQFLVENLLSAARFEFLTLKPTFSAISLDPWLAEIIATTTGSSETKEIKYTCPDLTVYWDETLMGQVLINLLNNAEKYAKTEIDMDVQQAGERVTLSIRDYGPNKDMRPFRQIKAFGKGRHAKSGLGLGLYLTDQIVRSHRGTIRFELADPGLRVCIDLPVRVTVADGTEQLVKPSHGGGS